MIRIALDLFGGDFAPHANVEGAKLALKTVREGRQSNFEVVLFGEKDRLAPFRDDLRDPAISFLPTPSRSTVDSGDPYSEGEDFSSPIRFALRHHSEGKCDGVVSAGSTGAQVLASHAELEKCSGITRPAVGSLFPTATGQCYLIDAGASLVATPHHLVQFAAMGHVYVHEILGIRNPRIGVVNVASESQVGERSAVGAYRLLSDSGFNFIGFVEGCDIPAGVADVVVTNGLVGNVLLKFTECLPALFENLLPAPETSDILESIKKRFDFEVFGGEPLLGVKGVSIICHGNSSEIAIASAIIQALRIIHVKLHEKIEDFLVDKFDSYFSRVKYLRSFRRSFRSFGRAQRRDSGKTNS